MAGLLLGKIWRLYVVTRIFLHYYWLKLIKTIVAWATGAPYLEDKYTRKLVVIGDGFAEGFGDNINFIWGAPGLAGRLETHFNEAKNRVTMQTWIGINRGCYKSTSDDWLPTRARDSPDRLTLWERTFGPRTGTQTAAGATKSLKKYPGQYADIFIVIVGAMDAILGTNPSDSERTVENIKQIVLALRAMDRHVFVASLPCKASISPMQKEFVDRRNRQLKEFVKAQNDDKLLLYPDLALPQYRQPEMYYYDQMHFNSRGYARMKDELVRELKQIIVQCEWKALRSELHGKDNKQQ